jgi:hypothetical protein
MLTTCEKEFGLQRPADGAATHGRMLRVDTT